MLDSVYHMVLNIFCKHFFGVESQQLPIYMTLL